MEKRRSWSAARWAAIKAQKANLVLFCAALFLVVLALLWRLVIAPAIKVVPTDIDLVRSASGKLTVYATTSEGQASPVQPVPVDVTIQQREFNPPSRSTSKVALLQTDTATVNQATRERLSDVTHRYAVDRRTARQVPGHGSDEDRSGYFLIFPFNTPRSDLEVWDELTARTQKASFDRDDELYGVKVYVFKEQYAGQPVPVPQGYPRQMTGAQVKAFLGRPDLPVADAEVLDIEYKANLVLEYLVEPTAGNLVGTRDAQESVYMSVSGGQAAQSFTQTQVVTKLDYTDTAAGLQEGAAFAADEMKKIRLQFVYLPVGFFLLGLACLLIAVFTTPRPDPRVAGGQTRSV